MSRARTHPYEPHDGFDGGELDCGNGLLLLIRKHIDPLEPGQLLEILSMEASVEEDLPAWCRLTGNEMVNMWRTGRQRSFLVSKGPFTPPPGGDEDDEREDGGPPPAGEPAIVLSRSGRRQAPITQPVVKPTIPDSLPAPTPAPAIEPLSVMGVGSWPRPRWLLRALHEHLETRIDDAEFDEQADDAVRLAVDAQLRAGADVV
ncbi:MAG: 5-methyltetrahydropteroyltriglutamate--homocysteine methyltransferase, partial [Acidimicrobiales bacterium]